VDPIEKKPFYHWFPGTEVFSFAACGCNFRCRGCQNWGISQSGSLAGTEVPGEELPPKEAARLALENGCAGIAYTYTEPTIFFEYATDTAALGKAKHLYSVFVSNGYMTPEAIALMKDIDASRIDLKFMEERLYNEYCGVRGLEHILDSIRLLHKKGHIELINLVIPGLNDSDDSLKAVAGFSAGLDKDIPLHFIAFHPANKAEGIAPTPVERLERARQLAMDAGVRYAYVGNVPGHPGENTYCPGCGELAIERSGFSVARILLDEKHRCESCGTTVRLWDASNYPL
jgi:pyruvate formate lyase activating enzyme